MTFFGGQAGRPKRKRLVSGVEKYLCGTHKKGTSNTKSCSFCNKSRHVITTCKSRQQWGFPLKDQNELHNYCSDLCNVLDNSIQIHWDVDYSSIISNDVMKHTEFISMKKSVWFLVSIKLNVRMICVLK